MRSHRFAPEENSKERQNDTDNVCDGGRNTADDGCFGDLASCADCASEHRGYRRPKQCNAGILVSSPLVSSQLASSPLVSSSVVSPSPSLLARPLRASALRLGVIGRPPTKPVSCGTGRFCSPFPSTAVTREVLRIPLKRNRPSRWICAATRSAGGIGSIDKPRTQRDREIGAIELVMRLRIDHELDVRAAAAGAGDHLLARGGGG